MPRKFAAVFENGVLRPLEPLRLAERQRVALSIDESPVGLADDVLDQEFLRNLEDEDLPDVTLEEVRAALAKIPESMTAAFISEREERF